MSSKKRTFDDALLNPEFGESEKSEKSMFKINLDIKTEQHSSGDSVVNDDSDTTIVVVEKPNKNPTRSAGKKPIKKKKNSNPNPNPIIIAENPVILAENPVVVTVTEKPIIVNEKPIQSSASASANTVTNSVNNTATNTGINTAINMATNTGINMPPPNQAQLDQLKRIKEQLVPNPGLNDIYKQVVKLRLQDHQNLKTLFMMTNNINIMTNNLNTMTNTIMNDVKSLKRYTHLLNVDRKHNMTISELMDLCDTLNGDSEEIMVNWFTSLFKDRPDSFRDLANLMNCAMSTEQKSILEEKKTPIYQDPFSVLSDTTDIIAQNMALDYEIFCNNNN